MAQEPNPSRSGGDPAHTEILLSISLKTLCIAGGLILTLGGLVIRLYMASVDRELRALAQAQSTVELKSAANERRLERNDEQHLNYDRAFEAIWKKFDRLEDDRWNRKH